MNKWHLAVDIGASSGKALAGRVENGKIITKEIYRFQNFQIEKNGHLCWQIESLIKNVIISLKAWRIVWGLEDNARPTSEFPSHFLNHSVRASVTNGNDRVIYHCHPANLIALTFILPLNDRTFSRVLWESMTECPVIFPEGVGVVPWMVPGSADIAKATSELMKKYQAAVWTHHDEEADYVPQQRPGRRYRQKNDGLQIPYLSSPRYEWKAAGICVPVQHHESFSKEDHSCRP